MRSARMYAPVFALLFWALIFEIAGDCITFAPLAVITIAATVALHVREMRSKRDR